MRAASAEPWPLRSEYRLDMSVRTPILTTLSEIWAWAVPARRTRTATSVTMRPCVMFVPSPRWCAIALLADLHSKVLVQLVQAVFKLGVRDHVHHPAVLHDVV